MEVQGEYRLPMGRDAAWKALIDPEVLKKSIPGCDEMTKMSDTGYEAAISLKIGAIKARFLVSISLTPIAPPEKYLLAANGHGGMAGFAKGTAEVTLTETAGTTLLAYKARADIGGKLASLGQRLLQGTADKLAADFFGRFTRAATGEALPPMPDEAEIAPQEPIAQPKPAPSRPQRKGGDGKTPVPPPGITAEAFPDSFGTEAPLEKKKVAIWMIGFIAVLGFLMLVAWLAKMAS